MYGKSRLGRRPSNHTVQTRVFRNKKIRNINDCPERALITFEEEFNNGPVVNVVWATISWKQQQLRKENDSVWKFNTGNVIS